MFPKYVDIQHKMIIKIVMVKLIGSQVYLKISIYKKQLVFNEK